MMLRQFLILFSLMFITVAVTGERTSQCETNVISSLERYLENRTRNTPVESKASDELQMMKQCFLSNKIVQEGLQLWCAETSMISNHTLFSIDKQIQLLIPFIIDHNVIDEWNGRHYFQVIKHLMSLTQSSNEAKIISIAVKNLLIPYVQCVFQKKSMTLPKILRSKLQSNLNQVIG